MRIQRPKLRVGTLLIAVAAFALGIGADRAYNRYRFCMERADYYRSRANSHMATMLDIEAALIKTNEISNVNSFKSKNHKLAKEQADRFDATRAKFERAAYLPFLPIPDDPEANGIVWRRASAP